MECPEWASALAYVLVIECLVERIRERVENRLRGERRRDGYRFGAVAAGLVPVPGSFYGEGFLGGRTPDENIAGGGVPITASTMSSFPVEAMRRTKVSAAASTAMSTPTSLYYHQPAPTLSDFTKLYPRD